MTHRIGGLLLVLACAAPARAHFVWLVPDAEKGTAIAVFGHELAPEKGSSVARLAQAEYFARGADGKTEPLKATAGEGFYQVSVAKGTDAVGAVCRYGVVAKGKGDPYLLVYHATALFGPPARPEAPWERMALEVVPLKRPGACRVLWQGKPLAGAAIEAKVPGMEEFVDLKSDASGEVQLPAAKGAGLAAVLAQHVETRAGEHDGKAYKVIRHYATAVFPVGAKAAPRSAAAVQKIEADPAASKLLADARAARAEWNNFPGFTADLAVNVGGKRVTGQVEVSAAGKVKVELPDEAIQQWARGQLASVVGHRLPGASERDTPCAFLDANDHHPMGRAIRVLNDELHSSYRVRGREIIEVNRTMKTSRFTITVLESRVTPEKKYLPAAYVVNTWDVKTGALVSSAAFHHEWQRLGAFDLPAVVTVVTARGATDQPAGPLEARTITLTNHKLSR